MSSSKSYRGPEIYGASGRGFSLVELIIAMGLGVFLSSVMVFSYTQARAAALYDEQISSLQENARFALGIMTRELSLAGFQGAVSGIVELGSPDPLAACESDLWSLGRSRPLQIVNDYSRDTLPESGDGERFDCLGVASVADSTDLVAIRRSASVASVRDGTADRELVASATPTWFLRSLEGVAVQWERQRPRDLPAIAAGSRSTSFWKALGHIIFIRPFSQIREDNLPSLCMKMLAGTQMTTRCLVEGIENMQLEFGLDTNLDGVANIYVSGLDASNWHLAVTARVHLLVRSVKAVSPYVDVNSYQLGSVVVQPARDRHVRRVFTATVSLRNLGARHG